MDDLECMACPPKYRHLATFWKYYSGQLAAPYPTLFSEPCARLPDGLPARPPAGVPTRGDGGIRGGWLCCCGRCGWLCCRHCWEESIRGPHCSPHPPPLPRPLPVGGNHEAANHLWELYHGGWAAPNIHFLGYAGVSAA